MKRYPMNKKPMSRKNQTILKYEREKHIADRINLNIHRKLDCIGEVLEMICNELDIDLIQRYIDLREAQNDKEDITKNNN